MNFPLAMWQLMFWVFAPEGFAVTSEEAPYQTEDFQLHVRTRAMLAQSTNQFEAPPSVSAEEFPASRAAGNGSAGAADADGAAARRASGARAPWSSWPSTKGGDQGLARRHGQADSDHEIRRATVGGSRMVPRFIWTFGAAYAAVKGGFGDGGGHLRPPDCERTNVASIEVQRSTTDFGQHVCASEVGTEGRWQQRHVLHLLQDVPESLGKPYDGCGDSKPTEEPEDQGPLESKEGSGGGFNDDGGTAILSREFGKSVEQHEGHVGRDAAEHGDRKGRDAASSRTDVEGVGSPAHRGAGERHAASESTAGSSPGEGEAGRASKGATAECRGDADSERQLREVGGEIESEERGTTTGSSFLQMHATGVRVLRMGEQSTQSSAQRDELHPGLLECEGVRSQPAPQQEPQNREQTPCVRDGRCGDGVGHRVSAPTLDEQRWLVAKGVKGVRTLRRLQRGENPHYEPAEIYEVENAAGEWVAMKGRIALDEKRRVRVLSSLRPRAKVEEVYGVEKEKQLSRKERKAVEKSLAGVVSTVSEVFSPPRIAPEAERQGLKAGSSFDLITGWDLSQPKDRKRMWQSLKEEDPMLIVLSPPCGPFSVLQEWNLPRMSWEKAVCLIQTGVENLELAMLIAAWQARRGRYVLFEHPWLARSWKEEMVERVLQIPGMIRVRCDMCMFGLQVDQWGKNKKPTGLMLNSEKMAERLSRTCDHTHFHAPTLNGRPKKAQEYTPEFCKQVILGLKEQLVADGILEAFSFSSEVFAAEVEEEEDIEDDQREVAGELEGGYAISEEEKRQVLKMHKGLGHPQKAEFVRFMRAARIRGEVIRWAAHEFSCPACEARPRPKATRTAAIPRTYQPNRVLGIDLIYLPEVGGHELFPALSMLDWGSNYQMVERVPDKHPETMWRALWSSWFRTFGWPDIIICDPGKEFSNKFQQLAASCGVVVQETAAKAPWQNGRTERHGAHYKELLAKSREETVVSNPEELKLLMQEVEMAKNRFSNRSGYSPIQRQIGQWPKIPGTVLSDDVVDPGLLDGAVVDDMERSLELRRCAQKAFIEHNAKEALKKITHSRGHPPQEFTAGDYVYVYRVPRLKKRRHEVGPRSQETTPNRASWIGPGTLLVVNGASLWVSMFGELWRVAREQCRVATNVEKQGVEAALDGNRELIEEYKRSSQRKGYKDLRAEQWPEGEDERREIETDELDAAHSEHRQLRFEERPDLEEYEPTTPLERQSVADIEEA